MKKNRRNKRPRPRRLDTVGAGRALLLSMQSCRAGIGLYVAANRGQRKQSDIYRAAGTNSQALSDLEISKNRVRKDAALSLMNAAGVRQADLLTDLYDLLSQTIRLFGGKLD